MLLGWLDYIEKDLTVNVQSGRHRLLLSDKDSQVGKGFSSNNLPALLTRNSLTNLHDELGDIYFDAAGGNWSAGVNLWLGRANDRLRVASVPSNPGSPPFRTSTSVHAGSGDDEIQVELDASLHDGVVFVANGQDGNDKIDASLSSLPVILFGDDGDDELYGGSGSDVIIGDYGRVIWKEYDNIFDADGIADLEDGPMVAQAGGGGWGDMTDGVIRYIAEIRSVDVEEFGGNDFISMGEGDNVGIGGQHNDTIVGGAGRDIEVRNLVLRMLSWVKVLLFFYDWTGCWFVFWRTSVFLLKSFLVCAFPQFGDLAEVKYYARTNSPKSLRSIDCHMGGNGVLRGGPGLVDYLVGGSYDDELFGEDGMDLVFGDHASILLYKDQSHRLHNATTKDASCTPGKDRISLGPGDDMVRATCVTRYARLVPVNADQSQF